MKKILILIAIIFSCLSLTTAQVKSGMGGYATISAVTLVSGSTYNFTITGFVGNLRPRGEDSYITTDISVGDVIWTVDCNKFVIASISSNTGITMVGTMTNTDVAQTAPSNGSRIAVLREITTNNFTTYSLPPAGDGNSGAIAGIATSVASCIQAHYRRQDSIAFANVSGGGSLTANSVDSTHIKPASIAASDLSQHAIDTLKSQLNTDSISSQNAYLRALTESQKTASTLKVTFLGDSRTEFKHTGIALKSILQKRYKFHGDLGQGFGGFGVSEYTNAIKTLNAATLVDNTGDALYSTAGKCYTLTSAGSSFVQYAFTTDTFNRFTNLTVYYLRKPTGGTFEILVDGLVNQTVNTSGLLGVQSVSISGLSDAAHTLRFNYTTGGTDVSLLDMHISRNVSTGIMVNHVGHGGYYAAYYLALQNLNKKWYQDNPSDLYIIRFGGNDMNNGFTGAGMAGVFDSIAKNIKSVVPNASFLMLSETDLGEQGSITKAKAQEFVVEVQKMCQTKGYEFLNLYTLIPNWEQFYAQGYGDQYIHETANGGVVIGNYIYNKLTLGNTFATAVSTADSTWRTNGTTAYRTGAVNITGNIAVTGTLGVSSDISSSNFISTKVRPLLSNTSGVIFAPTLTQNSISYFDTISGWANTGVYSTGGTLGVGRLANINTNSKAHIALSEVTGVTMANYFDVLTIEGSTRNGIAFKSANTTDVGLCWNSPSSGASGSAFVYHNYNAAQLALATNQANGAIAFYTGTSSLKMKLLSNGNLGINTTTPQYKLDIDANTGSTGNPIRLTGLLAGSVSDSLVSSNAGVLKRTTINDMLGTTTSSLRVPRLTTTQRDALNGAAGSVTGDVIYNSTTGTYQVGSVSSAWLDVNTTSTIKVSNDPIAIPSITGMTTGFADQTVTGAVVGNTVIVNPRSNITTDNVILGGAYVVSTNTVRIIFFGTSVGTNGAVTRNFDIQVNKN